MTRTESAVVSGVAYPVIGVDGAGPRSLEQFLGDAEFSIEMPGGPYRISGCGVRQGDQVRFHEKDSLGRDVRVWRLRTTQTRFEAEHIAAF